MQLKQSIFIILSSVNFILTVYTVGKLIFFLSNGTSEKIIFWIKQSELSMYEYFLIKSCDLV